MIGQFAVSKAGHDKDRLYVIVAQEGEYVFLCDGKFKIPDKPKKKKRKHIQPITQTVDEELLCKLQRGGKIYPEEIKFAVKQYNLSHASDMEIQGAETKSGEQYSPI